MALNLDYSYKSFKASDLTTEAAVDFNNSEIIGASFYQRTPYSDVFPSNITGVTFIKCNLDNCNIPAGATVSGGTNKHILKQNDCEYWVVDTNLDPVEPRDKQKYIDLGLDIRPNKISGIKMDESIILKNDPKEKKRKAINSKRYDDAWIEQKLIDEGAL